jgi:hypothetical protein
MAKKSCKRNSSKRRYRGGDDVNGNESSAPDTSQKLPDTSQKLSSDSTSSFITDPIGVVSNAMSNKGSNKGSSIFSFFTPEGGRRRTKRHRKKSRSYKGGDGLSYSPYSLASNAAEFNGSGGRRRRRKRRGTKKQRGGFLDEPEDRKNKNHTGGFLYNDKNKNRV